MKYLFFHTRSSKRGVVEATRSRSPDGKYVLVYCKTEYNANVSYYERQGYTNISSVDSVRPLIGCAIKLCEAAFSGPPS
jgi:hypothetical protein